MMFDILSDETTNPTQNTPQNHSIFQPSFNQNYLQFQFSETKYYHF